MIYRQLWGWRGGPRRALRSLCELPRRRTFVPLSPASATPASGLPSIPTLISLRPLFIATLRRGVEERSAPRLRSGTPYGGSVALASSRISHPWGNVLGLRAYGPVALRASTALFSVRSASLASASKRLRGRWATPPEPPKARNEVVKPVGRRRFVRLGQVASEAIEHLKPPFKR
jgi:hypothetical protein